MCRVLCAGTKTEFLRRCAWQAATVRLASTINLQVRCTEHADLRTGYDMLLAILTFIFQLSVCNLHDETPSQKNLEPNQISPNEH